MRKPTRKGVIPNVPTNVDAGTRQFMEALRETVQVMQGQRGKGEDRVVTFADLEKNTGAVIGRLQRGGAQIGEPVRYPEMSVPTGVVVYPFYESILVAWDWNYDKNYLHSEVFRVTAPLDEDGNPPAEVPGFNENTLVGTVAGNTFSVAADHGQGYYFWVRHVNRGGKPGPVAGPFYGTPTELPSVVWERIEGDFRDSPLYEALRSSIEAIDLTPLEEATTLLNQKTALLEQGLASARERLDGVDDTLEEAHGRITEANELINTRTDQLELALGQGLAGLAQADEALNNQISLLDSALAETDNQLAQAELALADANNRMDAGFVAAEEARNAGFQVLAQADEAFAQGLELANQGLAQITQTLDSNVSDLNSQLNALRGDVNNAATKAGLQAAIDTLNQNLAQSELALTLTMQALQSADAAMAEQLDDLDSELVSARGALQGQINTLNDTIASANQQLTSVQHSLQTAIDTLGQELDAALDAIDDQLDEQGASIAHVTQISEDHAVEIHALVSRTGDSESEIASIKQVNSDQASAISGLATRTSAAESSIGTLQQTTSQQATQLNTLNSKAGTAESNISSLQTTTAEQAQSINALASRTDDAESEITDIKTVSAGQASQITGLASRVGSTESEITDIKTVNSTQTSQISGLTTRAGTAESNIGTLQSTTAGHATQLNTLNTKMDTAESGISSLQTTTAEQAESINTLTTRSDASDSEILSIQQTNATQATQITGITTRVGTAESKIGTLETTTGTHATRLASLGSYSGGKYSVINSLQQTDATQATQIGGLTTRTDTAESNISTLQTTTASQATQLTTLNTKVGAAESKIITLENTTGDQAAKIETLELRTDDTESEITGIKTVNATQATQLSGLTTRTGAAESNISSLQTTTGEQATQLNSLTTRTGTTESKISTLETTTGTHSTRLNSLGTYSGGKYSVINSLQQTDATQASQITGLTTRTTDAESSIETLQTTTATQATAISGLSTRTATAESSIATLQDTTADQATQLSTLNTKVGTAESKISTLETTTGTHATRLASLGTYSGGKYSVINSLQQTDATQATLIGGLTSRADDAESNITSLQTTTAGQTTQLNTLNTKVGTAESKIGTLETTTGTHATRLASLGTYSNGKYSEITALQQTDAAQAALITGLTTRTGTAESNISSLQTTTAGQTTQLNTLNTKVGTAESKISTLETTTGAHSTRLASLGTYSNGKYSEINSLQQTDAAQALLITGLTNRTSDAESNISSLQTTTATQATQIGSLTTRTNTAESKISTLESTTNGQATTLRQLSVSNGESMRASVRETWSGSYTGVDAAPIAASQTWLEEYPTGVIVNGHPTYSSSRYVYSTRAFRIDPTRQYRLRAYVTVLDETPPDSAGDPQVYVGMQLLDGNFANIDGTARVRTHSSMYPRLNKSRNRIMLEHVYTGVSDSTTENRSDFLAGTEHVRFRIRVRYAAGVRILFEDVTITDITEAKNAEDAATAYAESGITALNTVTASQAQAISGLTTRTGGAESNISTLQTTTAGHSTQLSTLNTKVGTAESKISTLETTTGTHATRLASLGSYSGGKYSTIKTLEETTADNASRITGLTTRTDGAESNITGLQTTTAGHATQLSTINTKVGTAESKISTLETTTGTHATRLASLGTYSGGKYSTIKGLEETTAENASKITGLTTRSDSAESNISNLQNTTAGHASQLNNLNTKVGDVESDITTLETTTGTHATRLASLGTFSGGKYSTIKSLEETTADSASKITGLTTRTGAAESSITGLQNTTATQATQISGLTTRTGTAESNIGTLQTTTAGHSTQLSTLNTKVGTAESKISTLETTTGTHATRLASLGTYSSGKYSSIKNLEDTTAGHATRLSSVETVASTATANITSLQSTAETHALTIAQLRYSSGENLRVFALGDYGSSATGEFGTLVTEDHSWTEFDPRGIIVNGHSTHASNRTLYSRDTFKIDPARKYRVKIVAVVLTPPTEGSGINIQFSFFGLNSSFAYVDGSIRNRLIRSATGLNTAGERLVFEAEYTGNSTSTSTSATTFQTGTEFVRLRYYMRYAVGARVLIEGMSIIDITNEATLEDRSRAYVDQETGILKAERTIKVDADGNVAGIGLLAQAGIGSQINLRADKIRFVNPDDKDDKLALSVEGGRLHASGATITDIRTESVLTKTSAVQDALIVNDGASLNLPAGSITPGMLDPAFRLSLVQVDPNASLKGGSAVAQGPIALTTYTSSVEIDGGGNPTTHELRISQYQTFSQRGGPRPPMDPPIIEFTLRRGSTGLTIPVQVLNAIPGLSLVSGTRYRYVGQTDVVDMGGGEPGVERFWEGYTRMNLLMTFTLSGVVTKNAYSVQIHSGTGIGWSAGTIRFEASEPTSSSGGYVINTNWGSVTGKPVTATRWPSWDEVTNKPVNLATNDDSRFTNSREWTASTVSQSEAEAGTASTRRAWTSLRVRQAANAAFAASADKTKLDGIEAGAQVNVATNLGQSRNATTYTITSSTGGNTALTAATATQAGVMAAADKTKLDGIAAGAQVNVATNLGYTASSRTLTSSTGSNVALPLVTTTVDGLMDSADKVKLNGIEAGAQVNVATNLGQSRTATTYTITSSTGGNTALAVATSSLAGVMAAADKSKLDGIAAGAQVNVATNLGYTASTRVLTSSTGSNVTLPEVTTSAPGLMIAADKTKLNGIEAGAQVNVPTNLGSSGTGGTRTITSSTGSNTSISFTAADVGAPPTSRTVTAGDGLSGGGSLASNRTISVDSTVVRTTGAQTIGGNKTFTGTSRFGNGSIGGVDGDAFIQTTFTGVAGEDNVHLYLQGVSANDAANEGGGAFIRFATSTSEDYGVKIGGRRASGGLAEFIVKTGPANPLVSMIVDSDGNIIASRGQFQGNGSGLTGLNASNLSSGVIPNARISGSYTGMVNLTGSGDVDFARFLGNASDTVSAPSYSWTGDTDTGMYRAGSNIVAITTGGTERARFSSAGIAGVGTNITALNASNLSTGTVADARISGVYSGITLKMTAANSLFSTSMGNNLGRHVSHLVEFRGSSSSMSGHIVFRSPLANRTVMHQFRIYGMLYSPVRMVDMIVQFYNTSSTLAANRAVIHRGSFRPDVKVGKDADGNAVVVLSLPSGTWSYPHIAVAEALFSHSHADDAYCRNWVASNETDLSTYDLVTPILEEISYAESAGEAVKLTNARTINGTSFNGTANITTSSWGTSRTLTIGDTGKSVNGSGNVSWSLTEIGAAARTITLSGGDGITTTIGNLTANRTISVDSTVVRTSGSQSISGTKTFTGSIQVEGTSSTPDLYVSRTNSASNALMRFVTTSTNDVNIGQGDSEWFNVSSGSDARYTHTGVFGVHALTGDVKWKGAATVGNGGTNTKLHTNSFGNTELINQTSAGVARSEVRLGSDRIQLFGANGVAHFEIIGGDSTAHGSFKVNGTTKSAGVFYAGNSKPTSTTRLNYDGSLRATELYEQDARVITENTLTPNTFFTQEFIDNNNLNIGDYDGIRAGVVAAGIVGANLVNSHSINVVSPPGDSTRRRLTLLPTLGKDGYSSGKLIHLREVNAAGDDTKDLFYVDTTGEGFFNGSLAKGNVDSKAISETAKKAINPYYTGEPDSAYWTGDLLRAHTAATSFTVEIASSTNNPLKSTERVFVTAEISDTVREDSLAFLPPLSSSRYALLLQRRINGGSWANVPGQEYVFTVAPFYTQPDPGLEYVPGRDVAHWARGFHYRRLVEFVDEGNRSSDSIKVQYRIYVSRQTSGAGTNGGIRFKEMSVEKEAFVKNVIQEVGGGTGSALGNVMFIDKETGYATVSGQVSRTGAGTIQVTFPKGFKTVQSCTLGYNRTSGDSTARQQVRYYNLSRTGVVIHVLEGNTHYSNTVSYHVVGTMDL